MPTYDNHAPGRSISVMEKSRKPLEILADAERQWIYVEADLNRTPSILDGMDPDTERTFRHKGNNFITQVGIMLKLPQTTLSSATVFFNRFLMRYSLVAKDKSHKPLHHYVSLTAIYFKYRKTDIT